MSPGALVRPVLVLGYGNPGRLDDGLGPALCRELESRGLDGVEVHQSMQLNVEDAARLAGFATVVFVDATLPAPGAFRFREVRPSLRNAEFSSHTTSPQGVVGLARQLFHARTRAYTLGIRGAEFGGFGEVLSPPARLHLDEALTFLLSALEGQAGEAAPEHPTPGGPS